MTEYNITYELSMNIFGRSIKVKFSYHKKTNTIDVVWLLKGENKGIRNGGWQQKRTGSNEIILIAIAMNIKFMTQIMKWDKNVYKPW